jgi:serine acetyltransferase
MAEEVFSSKYIRLRNELISDLANRIASKYGQQDLHRIVVPEQQERDFLAADGNGFPAESAVKLMLGNIRELVAPGHGYQRVHGQNPDDPQKVLQLTAQTFDALYAINHTSIFESKSLLGQRIPEAGLEELALGNTVSLLARIPEFTNWHRWNVFAQLRDPAIWSSAIRENLSIEPEKFKELKFSGIVDTAIKENNREIYLDFLKKNGLNKAYPALLEAIDANYDGPRALLNHYVAHQLAKPSQKSYKNYNTIPLYYVPEQIHKITRGIGLDFHPEAHVGYGIFMDHLLQVVMGQTGKLGRGCAFYGGGIVFGGISDKAVNRHPVLDDFVSIGTDTTFFGPIYVGSNSSFGVSTHLIGVLEFQGNNSIGNWVSIGSYYQQSSGAPKDYERPGKIIFEQGVRIGDHSIVINTDSEELYIPSAFLIGANSIVIGKKGKPKHIESHLADNLTTDAMRRIECRSTLPQM